MKVKDVMTREVKTCTPDSNLATVAMIMWENDCGIVPVVHSDGKVIGMITDRDICMAVATKNRTTSDVAVSEVFTGNLYACTPDDDIHDALKIMRTERVRRLPVINAFGMLEGILSLNDLVHHAQEARGKKAPALSYEDVLNTLKEICEHRVLAAACHL
jgi:CBS domain-containing protein